MDGPVRDSDRELLQLLWGPVYRYIWDKLNRQRDADRQSLTEDLVGKVTVNVCRSLHTLRPGAPLRPWVMQIAKHVLIDHYRRLQVIQRNAPSISMDAPLHSQHGENRSTLAELIPDPTQFEERVINHVDNAIVRQALAMLPDADRECLLLRYQDGYTEPELAKRYQVSVSAITSRLHRLRKAMKGSIQSP